MFFQRLGIALAAISLLSACADSAGPVNTGPALSSTESAVTKLGFGTAGMTESADFIIVEGDIALPKARLLSAAANLRRSADTTKGLTPTGPRLQWVTDARVNASNVSNIVVDLSGISSDQLWLDAVRGAMANWNAVAGTTIYFTEGSPAQIHVIFKNLGSSSVIAQAIFPIGATGQPGDSLFINSIGQSIDSSQKLRNMAHELGHTIGFRHTNWQGYDCAPYHIVEDQHSGGATLIDGTPQTDANSIMNGCTALAAWTGFSNYDQIAASVLYNNFSLTESNVGGYPVVLSTYSRGATSVELTIDHTHTEWYDYLQNFQRTTFSEFVDAPASGGLSNVSHPWGFSYCSDWGDYPYPQDETGYRLRIEYPQRTVLLFATADILDFSGSPGYSCF